MVSLQGNHEPNDPKYKYTVPPIRKNITHLNTSPESILGLLQDNNDFFLETIMETKKNISKQNINKNV